MNSTEIFDRVQRIFRQVFEDNAIQLEKNTTAKDIRGWDSFNHMNLIMTLEEEFQTKFSLGEVQSLKNVGDILGLLEKKKKGA